jgi:transposase-like protein
LFASFWGRNTSLQQFASDHNKAFHSAQATIAGIEAAHMIRKGQLSESLIGQHKSK